MKSFKKKFYKARNAIFVKPSSILILLFGINCIVIAQNTWVLNTKVPTHQNLYAVSKNLYGLGSLYTVGDSGTILSSTNGSDWINIESGVKNTLYGFTVGDSGIIISGNKIQESGTKKTLKAQYCSSSLCIIVGDSGTILASINGTWTPQVSGTTKNLNAITGNVDNWGSYFIVVGDSGTTLTSRDGIVWNKQNSGTSKNLNAVSEGFLSSCGDFIVAAGDSGIILSSQSSPTINVGINWSAQNSGTTNDLFGIHCIHDIIGSRFIYFLIVGAQGTILSYFQKSYTKDTLWTQQISGTTRNLRDATAHMNSYNNPTTKDSLIVVGDSGTILTSGVPDFPHGSKIIVPDQTGNSFFISSDRYTLSRKSFISINIYNLKGRLIKSIVNQMQEPGTYKLCLPSSFSHGAYILSLYAGGQKVDRLIMAGR